MDKNYVFDVDDTLGNFISTVLQKTRDNMSPEQTQGLEWYNVGGFLGEQFLEKAERWKVLESMSPFLGAKELLETAGRFGKVHIVTARGWHPKGYDITKEWFDIHGLYYDDIHIVQVVDSKEKYVRDNIGKIELIVEDNERHISEFKSSDISEKVLVKCQPWNNHIKDCDKVKRVTTLDLATHHC